MWCGTTSCQRMHTRNRVRVNREQYFPSKQGQIFFFWTEEQSYIQQYITVFYEAGIMMLNNKNLENKYSHVFLSEEQL